MSLARGYVHRRHLSRSAGDGGGLRVQGVKRHSFEKTRTQNKTEGLVGTRLKSLINPNVSLSSDGNISDPQNQKVRPIICGFLNRPYPPQVIGHSTSWKAPT